MTDFSGQVPQRLPGYGGSVDRSQAQWNNGQFALWQAAQQQWAEQIPNLISQSSSANEPLPLCFYSLPSLSLLKSVLRSRTLQTEDARILRRWYSKATDLLDKYATKIHKDRKSQGRSILRGRKGKTKQLSQKNCRVRE